MEERFSRALIQLQSQILAAGIPLTGLSPRPVKDEKEVAHFSQEEFGFHIDLHFADSASESQRQQAQQILAEFQFSPRKKRGRADLLQAIQSLSAQQRNLLMAAMAVDFLQRDPSFAEKLGINLSGDELDLSIVPKRK